MKRNYRKAYTVLKKMGVPVIEGGDRGEDTFRISAENNTHTCLLYTSPSPRD